MVIGMDRVEAWFRDFCPPVEYCSLRHVVDDRERLSVRQRQVQPFVDTRDEGLMVTVVHRGGHGYAATCDVSRDGLYLALREARRWAELSRDRGVFDPSLLPHAHPTGEYSTPATRPWDSVPVSDKLEQLCDACEGLFADPRIIDGEAAFNRHDTETLLLTSEGGRVHQTLRRIVTVLSVTAAENGLVQTRSLGGPAGLTQQGGMELIDTLDLRRHAPELACDACELLRAPPCPDERMDVILGPGQMILQIHESIGHPLELDRILGDERNYAGTSFVRGEDFGTLRYGSELLNITFDPSREGQFASYAFDDDGTTAEHQYLIREGVLVRGLGGVTSQARLRVPGVACSRASGWSRPPVDRMANVNLEPGTSSIEAMIAAVERGVLMDVNTSWSIDDARHKFQFSCEWGQLIEDGRLRRKVRNPGYRGITGPFWSSLAMVGDASTCSVLGTPNCGKGEPNQMIGSGHAAPACLFRDVDVFGAG